MEPQFRTSFVPKKPVRTGKPKPARGPRLGILFVLTLVIFLVSITLAVGMFLYQKYLESSIAGKTEMLEEARASFEPALVEELVRLDARLDNAETLLNQHLALSRLFDFLEESTLQSVQFENFRYEMLPDGNISLTMDGRARSFASVALQSDVFGDSEAVRSPVFEDLNVGEDGDVVFNVSAFIDTRQIAYRAVAPRAPANQPNAFGDESADGNNNADTEESGELNETATSTE